MTIAQADQAITQYRESGGRDSGDHAELLDEWRSFSARVGGGDEDREERRLERVEQRRHERESFLRLPRGDNSTGTVGQEDVGATTRRNSVDRAASRGDTRNNISFGGRLSSRREFFMSNRSGARIIGRDLEQMSAVPLTGQERMNITARARDLVAQSSVVESRTSRILREGLNNGVRDLREWERMGRDGGPFGGMGDDNGPPPLYADESSSSEDDDPPPALFPMDD